jgi:hypothetical protein
LNRNQPADLTEWASVRRQFCSFKSPLLGEFALGSLGICRASSKERHNAGIFFPFGQKTRAAWQ